MTHPSTQHSLPGDTWGEEFFLFFFGSRDTAAPDVPDQPDDGHTERATGLTTFLSRRGYGKQGTSICDHAVSFI
jgi:hypothetical protein